MSHVASVDCYVKDLDTFEQVVTELGGEVVRNKQTFGWFGRWVNDYRGGEAAVDQGFAPEDFGKCSHAVRIPGCSYELGLVERPDGKEGYAVLYDQWGSQGRKLHQAFGRGLSTLKQTYAERVAVKQLQRQGYRVRVEQKAGGARQIVGTRLKR